MRKTKQNQQDSAANCGCCFLFSPFAAYLRLSVTQNRKKFEPPPHVKSGHPMRAGVRDVMSRYVSQHVRRAFVSNGAIRGFISAHLQTTTPGASSIGTPRAQQCQLYHTSTVPFDKRVEDEASADRQDADCFLEAQPVPKLDPFAKSRVLQYLKRLPIVATAWIGGPQCVETLLVMGGLDAAMSTATSKAAFVSRILIPLVVTPPSTSNTSVPFAQWIRDVAVEGDDVLIATGVAHTTRGDADTLAAMHAERLLDATGRCLYVVPAAQRRYAAQRKAEGSHAPQPGDPIVKVPVANLPLPCTLSQKSCGGVHEVIRKLPRRPLHHRSLSVRGSCSTATLRCTAQSRGQRAPHPGDPIVKVPVANLPLPCTLSQKSCGGVHEVIRKLPRRPLHQAVAAAPSSPAQPFVQRVKKTSPPAASTQQGAALPNDEVVGVEDETENGTYMLCNVNTSRINSNPVIMTSPALIDKGSVARVSRRLFGLDDMLDRHVITTSEAVAGLRPP
ncbi:Hypothetical protein, putative [Bodo saltans]|uniref:REH2 DRSM domain-containing protein n=1 Tax=Bodo saltans TaxID=75058 RepID=A0A0S4IUT9_BODSA|nr:Hypothetical protein, putative [Bodo saltans]|eukprot:CUF99561.1 Hypothetical protein, putative [Bodo saltans]